MTNESDDAAESRGGGAGVSVSVDHEVCSSYGNCARVYREVFDVSGMFAEIRADVDWKSVDHARLRGAEDGCPWMAITVSEDEAS